MLSNYQLKIADFYKITSGNVKKVVPNFLIKKSICFIIKTWNFILKFNQSQWLKPFVEFNTQKKVEAEKNGGKDGKALYKLMNNVVCSKTMENLKNRIDVRLESNKKDYLK